jgi:hypothetical protein
MKILITILITLCLNSILGQSNNNINTIQVIFEEYIKYEVSIDSQENKDKILKSLNSISKTEDPNDLELLINVWMYYDPTDFPTRDYVYKILKSSKPESIEAIKCRIKNKKTWEKDDRAPYSELKELIKELEK